MTKHYVLSINPQAQFDWERCSLRNPMTGENPDFIDLVAQAVNNESGSYLVSVTVEVKVLEKAPTSQTEAAISNQSLASGDIAARTAANLHQLAAS